MKNNKNSIIEKKIIDIAYELDKIIRMDSETEAGYARKYKRKKIT